MSFYRTCRAAQVQVQVQVRGFRSSATCLVGPESPNYIDVPQPIQPDLPPKKHVKGTLPVPREIFPRRRPDKRTEAYISEATPLPTKQRLAGGLDAHDPQTMNYIEWKETMAETRRQNLREGLLELYSRKRETEKFMKRRSYAKQKRREEVLNQPEREDERLTRPSVIQEMLPKRGGVLPDPDREARLAASRAKFQQIQTNKRLEREEAVHSLYMNARNFITTEAQLAAEIERVFPDGPNEAWLNDNFYGESVWNLGVPASVQSTVTEPKKSETARWDLMQKRLKKLGEELTGGKI